MKLKKFAAFLPYTLAIIVSFSVLFGSCQAHTENTIFLNINDADRALYADALLRLKEYGAQQVFLDTNLTEKSPMGIDKVHMDLSLKSDFNRSFAEIDLAINNVISSLMTGRIDDSDLEFYAESITELIERERDGLYSRARNIARDNDLYLQRAMTLAGNVQNEALLDSSGRKIRAKNYPHTDIEDFLLLDKIEMELEENSRVLVSPQVMYTIEAIPQLEHVSVLLNGIGGYFDYMHRARNRAVRNGSDSLFNDFLEYRNEAYSSLTELLGAELEKIELIKKEKPVEENDDWPPEDLPEEIDLAALLSSIRTNLEQHNKINARNEELFRGKIVVVR
jgi:hypothetical protein